MKYEIMRACWKKETHDKLLFVDLYNRYYRQNIEMNIRLHIKYQRVQEIDKDLRWMIENRRKVTLQELETLILGKEDHYDT